MSPVDNIYECSLREEHSATLPKTLSCRFCPYKTGFQANLQKHERGKHSEKPRYQCNFCDFTANWSNMLKDHKISAHS